MCSLVFLSLSREFAVDLRLGFFCSTGIEITGRQEEKLLWYCSLAASVILDF